LAACATNDSLVVTENANQSILVAFENASQLATKIDSQSVDTVVNSRVSTDESEGNDDDDDDQSNTNGSTSGLISNVNIMHEHPEAIHPCDIGKLLET